MATSIILSITRKLRQLFLSPERLDLKMITDRMILINFSINHSFYELPSERSKRACSLGYGNKISLGKKTVGPPPDAYQIRSTFEKNSYSSIAFGKSRENIKFGNFL